MCVSFFALFVHYNANCKRDRNGVKSIAMGTRLPHMYVHFIFALAVTEVQSRYIVARGLGHFHHVTNCCFFFLFLYFKVKCAKIILKSKIYFTLMVISMQKLLLALSIQTSLLNWQLRC